MGNKDTLSSESRLLNVLVVVDDFVFTNPVGDGHAGVALGIRTKIRKVKTGS